MKTTDDSPKIVVMCKSGICRSVSLVDIFKMVFEYTDAVPIGYEKNGTQLKEMLFEWADKIIVMEEYILEHVPEKYKHKTMVCEVGPDTYFNTKHPQLLGKCADWARAHAEELNIKEEK